MRRGKECAQAAHASMKVLLDMMHKEDIQCASDKVWTLYGQFGSKHPVTEWLKGAFTKICVRVDSEAELLETIKKATEAKLPVAAIVDSGKTEFHGVPTLTCCAVGPAPEEEVDQVTGELKLL